MSEDRQAFLVEVRRAGLAQLLETHWSDLEKAKASAEELMSSIPRGLHMYAEPAHVFRAMQRREYD